MNSIFVQQDDLKELSQKGTFSEKDCFVFVGEITKDLKEIKIPCNFKISCCENINFNFLPKEIKGSFILQEVSLRNLENFPTRVGGIQMCGCKIESWKGLERTIIDGKYFTSLTMPSKDPESVLCFPKTMKLIKNFYVDFNARCVFYLKKEYPDYFDKINFENYSVFIDLFKKLMFNKFNSDFLLENI